jgi:hypothetical protein
MGGEKVKERLEFLSPFQAWRNDSLVDRTSLDGEDLVVVLCLLVTTPGDQDKGDEECLPGYENVAANRCTPRLLRTVFANVVGSAGMHRRI